MRRALDQPEMNVISSKRICQARCEILRLRVRHVGIGGSGLDPDGQRLGEAVLVGTPLALVDALLVDGHVGDTEIIRLKGIL